MVDRQEGIGYLKLTCFQKTTSRDLDTALFRLKSEGMRSLIMDLRGNPGGLLTASVEVVDKFVHDGVIVSTRGRSSLEDYNYTAHKAGTWDIPLAVLIDGDSASTARFSPARSKIIIAGSSSASAATARARSRESFLSRPPAPESA